MEFAIYSYVDLDHYQYVGMIQRGFTDIETANNFLKEFDAGNFHTELIGTTFVSTFINDESINVCSDYFDPHWDYDVNPAVKIDMTAKYRELVLKYFPEG